MSARRRVRIDDEWRTLRHIGGQVEPRVSRTAEAGYAAIADAERLERISAERREYQEQVAAVLAEMEDGLARLRDVLERRDRRDYREMDNIRRALAGLRRRHID